MRSLFLSIQHMFVYGVLCSYAVPFLSVVGLCFHIETRISVRVELRII